ncbi:MAG: hypothetical protein QXQ81_07955 [Candidatus Thorarchaeota archaeon]
MTKKMAVVQLRGCDRCAWQTLLLTEAPGYKMVAHPLLKNRPVDDALQGVDLLVLTGYGTREDIPRIRRLVDSAKKTVAFGTCPQSGGIFGLLNQRGGSVIPVSAAAVPDAVVPGCPPTSDELMNTISGSSTGSTETLCKSCKRKFEQGYFAEIHRQGTCQDDGKCFNNIGLPCHGVVAGQCAQRCIDYGAPCRGCVGRSSHTGASMLSYFGSLAFSIEVATVGNWWTTDKLSNDEDDLTRSLPDVTGTFFRFHLADEFPRGGRVESSGDVYADIMVGRPVEEAIQIAGTIYGSRGISVALNLVEGYEECTGMRVSNEVRMLRNRLRQAQQRWVGLTSAPTPQQYTAIATEISRIGGNSVLSNLFFGGFRTPIQGEETPFEAYRNAEFVPSAATVSHEDGISRLTYVTDERGVIRRWSCEL